MRKTAVVAALSATALVAGAATASAAPKTEPFDLQCDDGRTYTVVTNGAGSFTPAHVVGSTMVLVPIRFGDNVATVVTPDGETVTMPFPDDEKGKGNVAARNPGETLLCHESFTFTLDQPEMGFPAGSIVTVEGTVLVYVR